MANDKNKPMRILRSRAILLGVAVGAFLAVYSVQTYRQKTDLFSATRKLDTKGGDPFLENSNRREQHTGFRSLPAWGRVNVNLMLRW